MSVKKEVERYMEMMAETFSIMKPFGLAQKENIVSSLADFLAHSCCEDAIRPAMRHSHSRRQITAACQN